MLSIARTTALVAILISPFWLVAECEAQKKSTPTEYDYYSLAITSILTSGAEAAKLPDVPQRVSLLIRVAKILPVSQHDEAIRLLDVGLRDVKEWGSAEKASWNQQHAAATLCGEILAVYAVLDPEKTAALQKDFQAAAELTTGNGGATSPKNNDWLTEFTNRRTIADQSAKIALPLIDSEPDKALALVIQSLRAGMVSRILLDIVQKLIQNGNRATLNKFEIGIGQTLAANVTLDFSSLSYASALVRSDNDMPPITRGAFVSFFMHSLQAWSNLVREPGIDTFYISTVFTRYSLDVRPVILEYAPDQLLMFDSVLDQVAPLVPENTRSRLQAIHPEKFSDPRDSLNDILKDPNADKRDLRLIRLASQLMRNESGDVQKNLELAAEAITSFSDPDAKSAFVDLLTITRVNSFAKQKKFIEAQRLAGSISAEETRAWALLALSALAERADRVIGFTLINNALDTLDKASPSPRKVELALRATAMLAKDEPSRAFDALAAAVRYANSSPTRLDPPAKPAVGFGLDAAIGDAKTKIGVFPESLGELEIDPLLSTLGTTDWFRANQMVDGIREAALRLRLKLEFARAMIAEEPKPKKKETMTKPSSGN